MKKRNIVQCIFLFLLMVFFCISMPEYKVHNSISFSNGSNRDTELNVVVYQYWKKEDLAEQIKDEYNRINGTPTTLVIKMYYSELDLRRSKPFEIVIYE